VSITNQSRGWGDSVREYGNGIKDATGASGPRSGTATNPLGIARNKESARLAQQAKKGSGSTTKGTANNPLGL